MHATPNYGLLWLVALGLLGSFISLYYYLSVLKAVFVDNSDILNRDVSKIIHLDLLQRISLGLLAGIVLVLGLLPDLLVSRIMVTLP